MPTPLIEAPEMVRKLDAIVSHIQTLRQDAIDHNRREKAGAYKDALDSLDPLNSALKNNEIYFFDELCKAKLDNQERTITLYLK